MGIVAADPDSALMREGSFPSDDAPAVGAGVEGPAAMEVPAPGSMGSVPGDCEDVPAPGRDGNPAGAAPADAEGEVPMPGAPGSAGKPGIAPVAEDGEVAPPAVADPATGDEPAIAAPGSADNPGIVPGPGDPVGPAAAELAPGSAGGVDDAPADEAAPARPGNAGSLGRLAGDPAVPVGAGVEPLANAFVPGSAGKPPVEVAEPAPGSDGGAPVDGVDADAAEPDFATMGGDELIIEESDGPADESGAPVGEAVPGNEGIAGELAFIFVLDPGSAGRPAIAEAGVRAAPAGLSVEAIPGSAGKPGNDDPPGSGGTPGTVTGALNGTAFLPDALPKPGGALLVPAVTALLAALAPATALFSKSAGSANP